MKKEILKPHPGKPSEPPKAGAYSGFPIEARAEIDEIDREMRELFLKRMQAVQKIAEYKKKNRLPIYVPEREAAMMQNARASCKDDALRPYYVSFLKNTVAVSRAYQNDICASDTQAKRLTVSLGDASYPIFFGRGTLKTAGSAFALERKVFLVTDRNIPAEYIDAVCSAAKETCVFQTEPGEKSKCFEEYERLLCAMADFSLGRSDCVIAVGGGVISDLAGFAAATYMRGIDFYTVPTSLLAMADASVGGKCAIDLGTLKNTVGSFHQPKAVIIDPDLLKTLPERELRAGLAEIVKVAFTSDESLLSSLEKAGLTDEAILRAVTIKKTIVEADACESGERRLLNFGHTLGHAMESAAKGGLLHGEAVALGMIPMCEGDTRQRLISLLKKIGLPAETTLSAEEIAPYLTADKKRAGDLYYAVTVKVAGHGEIAPLTQEQLLKRLKESGICR